MPDACGEIHTDEQNKLTTQKTILTASKPSPAHKFAHLALLEEDLFRGIA